MEEKKNLLTYAEALMKVLNNPEMAALLAGLAKGVTV